MRETIAVIWLCVSVTAMAQSIPVPIGQVPPIGNFIEKPPICILKSRSQTGFDGTYVSKITVSNLWYRDNEGYWSPTSEMYLTVYYRGHRSPLILDWIEGFGPKLMAVDLAGDGHKQVILEWTPSAHGTGLRIYRFLPLYSSTAPMARVNGPQIGSNVNDIQIVPNKNGKGYVIVTKNNMLPEYSKLVPVEHETYVYKDHKMVLQSQTSSQYRK